MKNYVRKFGSLLLVLVMVLALNVSAFAAMQGTLDGGSITIKDAVPGQQYNAYQILYIESYNAEANAYSYKANSAWEAWLKTQTDYVSFDDQGYVTWVGEATAERAQAFAQLAQAQAKNMAADASATAPDAAQGNTYSKVTFTNLKLGYYLIDSTLGTLCSIDTTNPTAEIEEKNEVPTNEKKVEEDSNPGVYGKENDADIGQTVNFQSTIVAQKGAENYLFHDKMSEGLTFGSVTGITLNGNAVTADKYTVKTGKDVTDGCTFEVVFSKTFCDSLAKNDSIVISYTATVNENAVIGDVGNPNESKLSYGDASNTKTTPPSTTTTYTWKLDVFKHNSDNKGLEGAKFVLARDEEGKNLISLIDKGGNSYRVAKDGEEGAITEITTDATGKFTVEGLDSDTYYLVETKAPAGYNTLKAPVKVEIGEAGAVSYTYGEAVSTGEIKVLNQTGAELPSTGGMGTTMFYILGSVLVLGAAVVLITRKRMSKHN